MLEKKISAVNDRQISSIGNRLGKIVNTRFTVSPKANMAVRSIGLTAT
jgi:hypothetical protein